jgi:hypothetical protein
MAEATGDTGTATKSGMQIVPMADALFNLHKNNLFSGKKTGEKAHSCVGYVNAQEQVP